MIPRTKHLALIFGILTLILVAAFVYLTLRQTHSAFVFVPPQSALALESVDTEAPMTSRVLEDTTRENTRRSLIARLQNYEGKGTEEVVSSPSMNEQSIVETVPSVSPIIKCENGSVSGSGTTNWGPVNVNRAEGARIVASLVRADTGEPLHTIQLVDEPRIAGTPQCLPEGMIGISLDGRVIQTETAYATNVEGLAAYALDGFGIFGAYENGGVVTGADLDQCHGHIHAIVWNGVPQSMYHYHVTADFPYTLGCYRGTPVQ